MPNIRQYEDNSPALRPTETGAEAWNRAGMRIDEFARQGAAALGSGIRRLGQTAETISDVVEQQQTQHEITQGAAQASAFLANKTKEWRDTLNAPGFDINNVDQARADFMDKFQQDASQFMGAFHTRRGQEFAASHMASMATHFDEKTIADVSLAAGQALKVNWAQTIDNLATAIHNDPSSLDHARSMLAPTLDEMINNAHGLSPEDRIRAKTELLQESDRRLTHLGIAATMDHDVAAGTKMLSGPYGKALRPEDIQELQNYGKAVTRAKQADADHAMVQQMRAEQRASEAMFKSYAASLVQDGQIVIPQNANAQLLSSGMKPNNMLEALHLTNTLADRMKKPDVGHDDPTTVANLFANMGNLEAPTTRAQVIEKIGAGLLSTDTGIKFLHDLENPNSGLAKLANDPVLKAQFSGADARIAASVGPSMVGFPNMAVKNAQANFRADTLRILQDAMQHGQDIRPLLDPNSSTYLFDTKRIDERYLPTKDQLKTQLLTPYQAAVGAAKGGAAPTPEKRSLLDTRPSLEDIISKSLGFTPKRQPPPAAQPAEEDDNAL